MSKKATPRGRKATAEGASQDDVGGSGGSGDRNPTEFHHGSEEGDRNPSLPRHKFVSELETFDRNNFSLWRMKVESTFEFNLGSTNYLEILEDDSKGTQRDLGRIYSLLLRCIPMQVNGKTVEENLPILELFKSLHKNKDGREAWKKLCMACDKTEHQDPSTCCDALFETEMKPKESVTEFVSRMESVFNDLSEIDVQIPNALQAAILLRKMRKRFPQMRNMFVMAGMSAYSWDNVVTKALKIESQEVGDQQQDEFSNGLEYGKRSFTFQSSSKGAPGSQPFSGNCNKCGRKGHKAAQCRIDVSLKCDKCGLKGHKSEKCRVKVDNDKSGSASGGKAFNKDKAFLALKAKVEQMEKSQAQSGASQGDNRSEKSKKVKESVEFGKLCQEVSSPATGPLSIAEIREVAKKLTDLKPRKPGGVFVGLDTCSSSSMFNISSVFTALTAHQGFVENANGVVSQDIVAIGSSLVSLVDSDGDACTWRNSTSKYTPDFPMSLVSMHDIEEATGELHIQKGGLGSHILFPGDRYIPVFKVDRIYVFEIFPCGNPDLSFAPCNSDHPQARSDAAEKKRVKFDETSARTGVVEKCFRAVPEILQKTHCRLCHVNLLDVAHTADGSDGLLSREELDAIEDYGNVDEIFCDKCPFGKAKDKPVRSSPDASVQQAEKPGYRIYSDTCQLPIPDLAGHRYVMIFVDERSDGEWSYLLHSLKEAPSIVRQFQADTRDIFPDGISIFRTDNGTEYTSAAFNDYLVEFAIKHEHSAPYSQFQNGKAEVRFRIYMELVRCILKDADLPHEFWGLAFLHVNYVRFRLVRGRSTDGISAQEFLTGAKPDFRSLVVFGCDAYVAIPHRFRNKLDDRAIKGIFVGYDRRSPAILVYDPASHRILKSRNVIFNESGFSGSVLRGTRKVGSKQSRTRVWTTARSVFS